ncbi:hypothetical protein MMC28_008421 [Mycoblastus sanguinarius]|nr:hypothetical protein [Mycoblastus sanguinarius]
MLILIVTFLVVSTCALILPLNITSLGSEDFNVTAPPQAHCNASTTWLGASTITDQFIDECVEAEDNLWKTELEPHSYSEFEFAPAGVTPVQKDLPTKRTPRRYTVGACTLAIINFNELPAPFWEGAIKKPLPPTDVADFWDIRVSLAKVYETCLYGRSKGVGVAIAVSEWFSMAKVGQKNSIGVFLFGTGSPIDAAIPEGIRLVEPFNATIGVGEGLDN